MPSDVGRYWHVAVCVNPDTTVFTDVHPGIALLFAKNVTFDEVFTRATIGLVNRYVVLIEVSSAPVVGAKTLVVAATLFALALTVADPST